MREQGIHDVVDRALYDRQALTTIYHTPTHGLHAHGLPVEQLEPAEQLMAVEDDRDGAGCTPTCDKQLADLADAERDYSRAIDSGAVLSTSELAALFEQRAVCRLQLGDHTGAVADAEWAVALAPRRARYHADLGRARRCAGDPAGALCDLERALVLDPADRLAWHERGRCHQALDQHEHALADFGHLLTIGRASYYTLVERAQSHLALGNCGMALIECEIAARQMPAEDARVYQLRGQILFLIGDLYGALCDLSRAIGISARAAELYLRRGLVYRALGDHRSAREDMDEFARCHPAGAAAARRELAAAINMVATLTVPAA